MSRFAWQVFDVKTDGMDLDELGRSLGQPTTGVKGRGDTWKPSEILLVLGLLDTGKVQSLPTNADTRGRSNDAIKQIWDDFTRDQNKLPAEEREPAARRKVTSETL